MNVCDLDRNAYSMGHLLPYSNFPDFSLRDFPHGIAKGFFYGATNLYPLSYRVRPRHEHPELIYSRSYCSRIAENGPTWESRPNGATPKSDSSSGAPARRSLYKFHESFEPYIFSLSSRFARHVLLKYDNFTRVGHPPASACLLFLPRFAAPRQILICFCLQYFCSNSRFISTLLPSRHFFYCSLSSM